GGADGDGGRRGADQARLSSGRCGRRSVGRAGVGLRHFLFAVLVRRTSHATVWLVRRTVFEPVDAPGLSVPEVPAAASPSESDDQTSCEPILSHWRSPRDVSLHRSPTWIGV